MTPKEKITALAAKIQSPPSWLWKVLGGLLAAVSILWVRYLLNRNAEKLAAAKAALAATKLLAQQQAVTAKVDAFEKNRKDAEAASKASFDKALTDEAELTRLEAEHRTNVAQLKAVTNKDWAALNVLAGVK